MKWLVASISAIALAATGAAAQGNGNGNGNGNNNGKGNGGPAAMAGNGKADRGNGGGKANGSAARPGNDRAPDVRGNGNGNGNGNAKAPSVRANGNGNGNANRANNGNGNSAIDRAVRVVGPDRVTYDRDGRSPVRIDSARGYFAPIDGCPPGLAKKRNGCNPPGQIKNDRRYFGNYDSSWWGMPWLGNDRYYYDDGFLVRLGSDGRIGSWLPLLGGALSVGNAWPSSYGYRPLSPYAVNYYGLGQPDYYRYADNVAYRIDPETAAITSIAALLTGDSFTVGQPMPRGYDVYNVPYAYRDRYYDRPDAMYRYSDGYVYQVDPETRLVASAIELLVD